MFAILNLINDTNANKYLDNKLQNLIIYKSSHSIEFMSITRNYESKAKENVFNAFIHLENVNSRKLQKKIIVFLF